MFPLHTLISQESMRIGTLVGVIGISQGGLGVVIGIIMLVNKINGDRPILRILSNFAQNKIFLRNLAHHLHPLIENDFFYAFQLIS